MNAPAAVVVSGIRGLLREGAEDLECASVVGFHDGSARGGGSFVWRSACPRADHDGGLVISPTVPWDGSRAGLGDYLAGTGDSAPDASGCWVRLADTVVPVDFGAWGDGVSDDTVALAAAARTGASRSMSVRFHGLTYRITQPIVVSGHDFHLVGDGATIHRDGGPGQTSIFRLVDVQRVGVSGFTLHGNHTSSMLTTGKDPVIQIGSTDRADDSICEDVVISDNRIHGSNWAGIMIYGNRGEFSTVKNRRIWVHHNTVANSNNGVFVYKNAADILIEANVLTDLGNDGVVLDTRAQSDDRDSEPNVRFTVRGNHVSDFAKYSLGIGILAKGCNQDGAITGNVVIGAAGAQQGTDADNCGILLNADYGRAAPANVTVSANTIRDIRSPEGLRGFGLYVGPAARDITVQGNNILDCDGNGAYLVSVVGLVFSGNRVRDSDDGGTCAVRIDGTDDTPTVEFACQGNVVSGTSSGGAGIYLGNVGSGVVQDNLTTGFAVDVRRGAEAPSLPLPSAGWDVDRLVGYRPNP